MVPHEQSGPLAPLASMEDLSVTNTPLGTPLSTPGPSPRAKQRWSHRSSLGTILDEEEDDLGEDNQEEDDFIEDSLQLVRQIEQNRGLEDMMDGLEPMSTLLNIDRLTVQPNQSGVYKDVLPEEGKEGRSPLPGGRGRYNALNTFNNPVHRFQSIPESSELTQFLSPPRSLGRIQKFEEFMEERTAHSVKDRFGLVFCVIMINSLAATLPFNILVISSLLNQVLYGMADLEAIEYMAWFPSSSLPILALSLMACSAILVAPLKSRWFSRVLIISHCVSVVSTLILTILVMLESAVISSGSTSFPTVSSSSMSTIPTIILVFLSVLFLSSGVHLTEIFGCAGQLPKQYQAAIFIGMGLGVCITVLCQLFCLIFTTDVFNMAALSQNTAAIYVLILILAFLLASADLYLTLPLTSYYQDQHMKVRRRQRMEREKYIVYSEERREQYTMYSEYKSGSCCNLCWSSITPFLSIYLQSAVTFLAFPFIYREVEYSTLGALALFPLIFSFLPHSLMFCVGCLVASLTPSPPSFCSSISFFRVVMVPLFLLSSFGPATRILPVVLWDWSYAIIVFLWSFIGGYCMSAASQKSRSKWMSPFCLLGCLSGSLVSLSLVHLVTSELSG